MATPLERTEHPAPTPEHHPPANAHAEAMALLGRNAGNGTRAAANEAQAVAAGHLDLGNVWKGVSTVAQIVAADTGRAASAAAHAVVDSAGEAVHTTTLALEAPFNANARKEVNELDRQRRASEMHAIDQAWDQVFGH